MATRTSRSVAASSAVDVAGFKKVSARPRSVSASAVIRIITIKNAGAPDMDLLVVVTDADLFVLDPSLLLTL